MSALFTKINASTTQDSRQVIADRIASDFEAFLDAWHSAPEVYDNALDAQIHEWYVGALRGKPVFPPRGIPYFSPSAANADKRGLYEKLRGAKKDGGGQPPHQGRWTRLGTAIGDVIQRDILFAEKHGADKRFGFERDAAGRPMFEDFAKKAQIIEHNRQRFALYGTCDGILRYVTEDGEVLRVGLEVKSKQTTYAQTSDYSTRNGPKEDHVKQTVCYSLMYGTEAEPIDFYVILYVNASKKAWEMTDEEFAKSRDIKAFGIVITDEMRADVLDTFASVVESASLGKAPKLDINKWMFNGFKRACALSLTDEELADIEWQVTAFQRSGLPDWKKRGMADAFEQIRKLREEAVGV